MELAFLHCSVDRGSDGINAGYDETILVWHTAEMRPDIRLVPDTVPVRRFECIEDHVGQREAVHVPEDVHRTVDGADTFPVKLQVVPGSR